MNSSKLDDHIFDLINIVIHFFESLMLLIWYVRQYFDWLRTERSRHNVRNEITHFSYLHSWIHMGTFLLGEQGRFWLRAWVEAGCVRSKMGNGSHLVPWLVSTFCGEKGWKLVFGNKGNFVGIQMLRQGIVWGGAVLSFVRSSTVLRDANDWELWDILRSHFNNGHWPSHDSFRNGEDSVSNF